MKANDFIDALSGFKQRGMARKVGKFFKGNDGKTKDFGVAFGAVFKLAKTCKSMSLPEVNKLLDSDYYQVRMGAVAIMDFKARDKKTSEKERKALFDLYLARHDRLNNWDFPDRAAPSVIGRYLEDKPREILYELANSKDVWKRRTAIVSTGHFIRRGEVDETFRLAEILRKDESEYIRKAVGSWIREAGKKDPGRLVAFLEEYAATLPRITLRYAVEKLDKDTKKYLMQLGKS